VDDGRLRQVLLNLIGNAIKFTVAGEVKVAVRVDETLASRQRIRFIVADTGIGIHAAKLRHVFAPFSQAESSTTRRFGGTGLGLSISRRLIERMGGHIAIDSEQGKGTTVTVTLDLPVVELPPPVIDMRASALPPTPPLRADARILLAEDHPVNQALVRVQLGLRGYTCDVVEDGVAALEALKAQRYDLLLVDCHMPRMDGYAVAREVRRLETGTGRRLAIVAMTADARADQRELCLAAGMDDLLRKPIRLETFHAMVAHWLEEQSQEEPEIDMDRLRRAFGSDENIAAVIRAGVEATREALGRLPGVIERAGSEEVAGWIHHVLGGVNVFGASAVTENGERMEVALREGADVDREAVETFARDVVAFTDRLERYKAMPSSL
jgi:two-component system sensor histidine kinase EvgS